MAERIEHLNSMVHIRFQGQSWHIEARELGISPNASDEEVKRALAQHFEVSVAKFAAYVVERHENGNMTVRPEAVFG